MPEQTPEDAAAHLALLEEDNAAMAKRLVDAAKEIADLKAVNAKLSDENAKLAASGGRKQVSVGVEATLREALAVAEARIAELTAAGAASPEAPAPIEGQPEMIRVTHDHGFIEDGTNRNRHWRAGTLVRDPHEIRLLLDRKAPAVAVDMATGEEVDAYADPAE